MENAKVIKRPLSNNVIKFCQRCTAPIILSPVGALGVCSFECYRSLQRVRKIFGDKNWVKRLPQSLIEDINGKEKEEEPTVVEPTLLETGELGPIVRRHGLNAVVMDKKPKDKLKAVTPSATEVFISFTGFVGLDSCYDWLKSEISAAKPRSVKIHPSVVDCPPGPVILAIVEKEHVFTVEGEDGVIADKFIAWQAVRS